MVKVIRSSQKAEADAMVKEAVDSPFGRMVEAGKRLSGKLDALMINEADLLPPWENIEDGDAKRVRQVRALTALVHNGTIAAACRMAGINRGTFTKWLNEPEFEEAFRMAVEDVADDLEEIAILRAKAGSDPLMQTMLKAYRPEKFGEKKRVEHTGKDGEPLTVRIAGARQMLMQRVKALISGSSGTEEVSAEVMENGMDSA